MKKKLIIVVLFLVNNLYSMSGHYPSKKVILYFLDKEFTEQSEYSDKSEYCKNRLFELYKKYNWLSSIMDSDSN